MRDLCWVIGIYKNAYLSRNIPLGGLFFRRASWPAEKAVGLCGKVVTRFIEREVDLSEAFFVEGTREESPGAYSYDPPYISWRHNGTHWAMGWADALANDWEIAI